jgi:hypothetical protein
MPTNVLSFQSNLVFLALIYVQIALEANAPVNHQTKPNVDFLTLCSARPIFIVCNQFFLITEGKNSERTLLFACVYK